MIKLEDFKKLKKLDRIEYILRLNRIEEKNNSLLTYSLGITFMFIIGFLILLWLGLSNLVGIEETIFILNVINKIFRVVIPFLLLGFLVDMIFLLRQKIWKKKLEKEFFKVEVKPLK